MMENPIKKLDITEISKFELPKQLGINPNIWIQVMSEFNARIQELFNSSLSNPKNKEESRRDQDSLYADMEARYKELLGKDI